MSPTGVHTMSAETTLILIRADNQEVVAHVVNQFVSKGLKLIQQTIVFSKEEAEELFNDGFKQTEVITFVEAFTDVPLALLVVSGKNATLSALKMVGDVKEPCINTIRHTFKALNIPTCHIHASTEDTLDAQFALVMRVYVAAKNRQLG